MAISTFDLFSIGIGPSSSHTVGPMRAAQQFVETLREGGKLGVVSRVKAEMYGSLGATGKGHGTPKALLLGLEGEQPETVDVASIDDRINRISQSATLKLGGSKSIECNPETDIVLNRKKVMPFHSNGMVFSAFDKKSELLLQKTYYSVGGGFVVDETAVDSNSWLRIPARLPIPLTRPDSCWICVRNTT